jgi:CRISPR-associated protein Cmr2
MLLMPLPGVLGAARALATRLDHLLQTGVSSALLQPDAQRPTLRVGAAVCHLMDPYALLRERAQAAERYAKHGDPEAAEERQRGNALGLRLHIRSGQTLQTRLRFDDQDAFDRLAQWTQAYANGQLPGRVAFDTQHFGDHYQRQGIRFEVARSAYLRSLQRANERGGVQGISTALIQTLTDTLEHLCAELANPNDGYPALARLGNELVLARWLSAQTQNDLGERA